MRIPLLFDEIICFDNKKIITLFFQQQQQYILKKSSCQYSHNKFILQIKALILVKNTSKMKKMTKKNLQKLGNVSKGLERG